MVDAVEPVVAEVIEQEEHEERPRDRRDGTSGEHTTEVQDRELAEEGQEEQLHADQQCTHDQGSKTHQQRGAGVDDAVPTLTCHRTAPMEEHLQRHRQQIQRDRDDSEIRGVLQHP